MKDVPPSHHICCPTGCSHGGKKPVQPACPYMERNSHPSTANLGLLGQKGLVDPSQLTLVLDTLLPHPRSHIYHCIKGSNRPYKYILSNPLFRPAQASLSLGLYAWGVGRIGKDVTTVVDCPANPAGYH